MKTGILANARLGSRRLPQKHLLKIDGHPMFYYLLERMNREFKKEIEQGSALVIISSSNEPINTQLNQFSNAQLFLGDIKNIPKRHVQAADAFSLDAIVSVDGDDPLSSRAAMRSVYQALQAGANYAGTTGLPFGNNCMGYKTDFLKRCMAEYMDAVSLETGWGRVFKADEKKVIRFEPGKDYELFRFTMDYPQDYEFFTKVIHALGEKVWDASDEEIYEVVRQNRFYEINSYLLQEYWENFNKQVEDEKNEFKNQTAAADI